MVLLWFLVVADMKCLYLYVLLVCTTRSTANCVAFAILIGTYQLVNDIRARRGNACVRICSITQQSSRTELHFRQSAQSSYKITSYKIGIPASTGSRGVTCLSSLY